MKDLKTLEEMSRLIESKNISDSKKILDILINCLFTLSIKHHSDSTSYYEQKYAKLISQMVFSKIYNIQKNLNGINFSNQDYSFKNEIIDTNLIANNIRNLFETVCLFNNFFIKSSNKNEIILKLNIWEYSSLKYRTKLKHQETNSEQDSLLEIDENRLEKIIESIEKSEIYLNLQETEKKKIKGLLKNKDYKFSIIGNMVKKYDWQKLADNLPDKKKQISLLYTLLSFYSHPSWKSVVDFGNGFTEEKIWIENTQELLRYCYILTSIFIIDYINFFPKTKESFDELNLLDVYVIEFHNYVIRGEDYLLNKNIL